jgi:hypothetical protein
MDIWASRTPRKQAPLNINVGVLNIGNDPESQHSCGFHGFLRDDKLLLISCRKAYPSVFLTFAGVET